MTRMILAVVLLLGFMGPAWAETKQVACASDGMRSDSLPKALVIDIQSYLAVLGFSPGPADGVLGPRTRESIEAFKAESTAKSSLTPKEFQLGLLISLLPPENP